jgi:hypothetical protein
MLQQKANLLVLMKKQITMFLKTENILSLFAESQQEKKKLLERKLIAQLLDLR